MTNPIAVATQIGMTRKRTKTTVEKHEFYVIRRSRKLGEVLCAKCRDPIALVALDQAMKMSGISSRDIHRLIEAHRIHFAETTDGVALICPASLLEITMTRRTVEEL